MNDVEDYIENYWECPNCCIGNLSFGVESI